MQNICTLIFCSDYTVCNSRRKKLKVLSWNLFGDWQLHILLSYSAAHKGVKVSKKTFFSCDIHFLVSLGGRLHWAWTNIRSQMMQCPSVNLYPVIKLYWRILSVCLLSAGASIKDSHFNGGYLERRWWVSISMRNGWTKIKKIAKLLKVGISQSKLILQIRSSTKPQPMALKSRIC